MPYRFSISVGVLIGLSTLNQFPLAFFRPADCLGEDDTGFTTPRKGEEGKVIDSKTTSYTYPNRRQTAVINNRQQTT